MKDRNSTVKRSLVKAGATATTTGVNARGSSTRERIVARQSRIGGTSPFGGIPVVCNFCDCTETIR